MVILIGELSKRTGVNIETIRYYEKEDLMLIPPRSDGGRRQYDKAHTIRLSFIKRCRDLGFSLKDVRILLKLVDGGYTCSEVQALTLRHQREIRKKITDLNRLDKTLGEMEKLCSGKQVPDCPVIDSIFANLNQ
ncbi:MAG: helix-turn-helix domain-containing protein [Robiginitomaculum sp.]|nr:helix-turn-helix domain-containing protein [Robiginitomaculum sp.]